MTVEVVTPPALTNLTELETVKEELGITDNSKDVLLARYMAEASEQIVSITNREFARQTWKETIPGFGRANLLLALAPIVSITSVKIDDSTVTDYVIKDAKAGILYRSIGWPWSAQRSIHLNLNPEPNSEEPVIEVQYSGGYLMPGDVSRNFPGDLESAAIEMVKIKYHSKDNNPTLANIRVGDYSESKKSENRAAGISLLSHTSQDTLTRWTRID